MVHQTLLSLCALGLVLTVIPLVVLQIPDAVAWVVPPRVAAAGLVAAAVTGAVAVTMACTPGRARAGGIPDHG